MWPFHWFTSVLLTDLHHLHHGIDVAGAALLQGKSDDLRQDCGRDVLPGWDAAPWDASWNLRQKLIQEIKRNLTVKLVPKTKCMSVVNVRSYLLIDSNYLWPTSLFAATQTQTTPTNMNTEVVTSFTFVGGDGESRQTEEHSHNFQIHDGSGNEGKE